MAERSIRLSSRSSSSNTRIGVRVTAWGPAVCVSTGLEMSSLMAKHLEAPQGVPVTPRVVNTDKRPVDECAATQRSRFIGFRSGGAFLSSHNRPDRFCKLWEFIEYADCTQPFFVVEGGRSADHLSL